MTHPHPSFAVKVDVTNPGQFFACCGLLELSHRLWLGAEGWFEGSQFAIAAAARNEQAALASLLGELCRCRLSSLSESEVEERKAIEAKRRELRKQRKQLSPQDKERLGQLGTQARKGNLSLDKPFCLTLDWWQAEDDLVPKTWAGLQELHKIARAAQTALSSGVGATSAVLDYTCVMRTPEEYRKGKVKTPSVVEPFYFDARRFAHALDVGFSLDVQNAETTAHPAVELLCLIGLQRFRPAPGDRKWTFDYQTWSCPLAAPVAAAVSSGAVPISQSEHYQFRLNFRDDQKRYKAFGFARPVEE
jgi:CRISPR-associated protein Csb3